MNIDSLIKSFPLPLPDALKKAIVNAIPVYMKKHNVRVQEFALDALALANFTSDFPPVKIHRVDADIDGAPMTVIVLIGKKPD